MDYGFQKMVSLRIHGRGRLIAPHNRISRSGGRIDRLGEDLASAKYELRLSNDDGIMHTCVVKKIKRSRKKLVRTR
ncbi:hypothetical protein CEXT_499211 [Caerostris extrusa]|uniref:Uncharacterized protein n=1 Tax=Caerostris extrusa TaxID=172846 RepID=A0AAV4V5C7_CAEEX|nr:hypothetical protein CEXT_499211 [Caerostris extrusa]